jgi:hypothetical protein
MKITRRWGERYQCAGTDDCQTGFVMARVGHGPFQLPLSTPRFARHAGANIERHAVTDDMAGAIC